MSELSVQQFVEEALGHSSYLIGAHSAWVRAVIDPARDSGQYPAAAASRKIPGSKSRLLYEVCTYMRRERDADFIQQSVPLSAYHLVDASS